MSITPKKFNSVDINSESYLPLGVSPFLGSGYTVELDNYFVYIRRLKGIVIVRKSDYQVLNTWIDTSIFAGAKVSGNTIIITKLGQVSSLVATTGVVSDSGIVYGNEIVLTTSWMQAGNTVVPVVLENGKIIIAGEYYTGSASPYTINPVLYSLTVTGTTTTLYETKVLTSPGTTTSNGLGFGINLYKADTNRCIIVTGTGQALPGKIQLINVTTGAIALGTQTTASGQEVITGEAGYSVLPIVLFQVYPTILTI